MKRALHQKKKKNGACRRSCYQDKMRKASQIRASANNGCVDYWSHFI